MFLFFVFIDEGAFLLEPEASTYNTSTHESIFDHIRRKSKDFPLISKFDCMESINEKQELFTSDMAIETKFSSIVGDNILTSYMESFEVEKHASGFQYGTDEVKHNGFEGFCGLKENISKGGSSTNSALQCIQESALSTRLKDKKRSPDPISFGENKMKQHCSYRESEIEKSSLSETRGYCCSLETAGKTKEVDSNFGYQSVFSFL